MSPLRTARTAHTARPRHPARTELVRGIGPWTGLTLALVVGVGMYTAAPAWQGRWVAVIDELREYGILFGVPLALAAGCWHGGRERRRGTGELVSTLPRTPLRRTMLAALPAALWPAIGYLVAAGGSLLAAWPYVSGGRPYASLVLADAVALGSAGVLGFVAGRLVRWRLTAPLLALLVYITLILFSTYGDDPRRWLNPAAVHHYFWDRPMWWFGPAAMVWTAGLATAALLALAARRRAVAVLPLAAACTAAVVLVQTGDGLWRGDPAASRLVCDDGTPQVCVSAVDKDLLPDVSAALADLNGKLRGIPGAPTRWISGPGAPGTGMYWSGSARVVRQGAAPAGPAPGEVELPSPYDAAVRGRIPEPAEYANSTVGWLFSETCPDSDFELPGSDQASDIHMAVQQWLAPASDFASYEDIAGVERHLERLRAMDPAQGRAYLTRYIAGEAAPGCDPAEVPVP
ncbi:hypothetical protein [Streptomyces sp. NBC_01508]|uniref:hypothetical protein n=1 Tax=Streptomyces sp. NBC_01508 TaxID=2903888 RepID=UPI00386AF14A